MCNHLVCMCDFENSYDVCAQVMEEILTTEIDFNSRAYSKSYFNLT